MRESRNGCRNGEPRRIAMNFSILTAVTCCAMTFVVACGDEKGDHGGEDRQVAAQVGPRRAAEEPPREISPSATRAPMAFDERPAVGTRATCPVMKGEFVVSESTDSSEHAGKHYVFCCPGCKPRFDADPEKFIEG
jgi:YHS domain-containing protein